MVSAPIKGASIRAAMSDSPASHSTMPRGVSVAQRRRRGALRSTSPWALTGWPQAGTGGSHRR